MRDVLVDYSRRGLVNLKLIDQALGF